MILNIMISHSISCTECYSSIWLIIDAINTNPDFDIKSYSTKWNCSWLPE
jgi:hypothetical protein